MSSSTERIFIIGGTGLVGSKTVRDLLENRIAVTLYARSPEKVQTLFSNAGDLLQVIQGDFDDLTPIEEGIKGHTRLYLVASAFDSFVRVKKTIATYAYAAGVKQIVDISSAAVNLGWRTSAIGQMDYWAEKSILDVPDRGYLVTLRPTRFMGNLIALFNAFGQKGAIYNNVPIDFKQGWVSNNDVGAVAAVILQEDICKHADAVYTLTGNVRTQGEYTDILSGVLGQKLSYIQVPDLQLYQTIMSVGFYPHTVAVDLVDYNGFENTNKITPAIEILLGRKSESLKKYLTLNKSQFN